MAEKWTPEAQALAAIFRPDLVHQIAPAMGGMLALPPPGWTQMAGPTVSGLRVRNSVPNQASIGASFNNYQLMPGIRDVPFSAFTQMGGLGKLDKRTADLAQAIKGSGEINPLIVAMDKLGPYVLEGGHRFDALRSLGVRSFPAQVVRDLDE